MLQKVFATKILGTTISGTDIGGIHRLDSKSSMASCSNSTSGGGGDKCSSTTTIVMDSSSRLEKKGSVSSNGSGGGDVGSCSDDSLDQIGKRPPRDYSKLLKYFSLLVLILQNTALVLVTRYATTRSTIPFLKTVAVFWNEVVKIVVAFIFFFCTAGISKKGLHEFYLKFSLLDTIKLAIPAMAYTIQTFLLYVAIENLDAATFMVTYQLKILTTAFFTVLILKRRLSIWQWISLLILVVGVATVQFSAEQSKKSATTVIKSMSNSSSVSSKVETFLVHKSLNSTNITTIFGELFATNSSSINLTTYGLGIGNSTLGLAITSRSPSNSHHQNLWIGLLTVLAVCVLSGFAGVYIEKILKKDRHVSIWMQNIELGLMAIPFSLIVCAVFDGRKAIEGNFMQGFDLWVWTIVLLQSLGGIATAVVIKYADNILKSFAVAFGIILITIAAIFLFSVYPKLMFIFGAVLVIAAVVIYAMFPYKKVGTKQQLSEENGNLERRDATPVRATERKEVKFMDA